MSRLEPSRQWQGPPPDVIDAPADGWRPPEAWLTGASSILARLADERVARRVFRVYVGISWLA